jgi:hypothetical protein
VPAIVVEVSHRDARSVEEHTIGRAFPFRQRVRELDAGLPGGQQRESRLAIRQDRQSGRARAAGFSLPDEILRAQRPRCGTGQGQTKKCARRPIHRE